MTVQDFLDERIRLPSPPAIALKILEAVRQEDNSFDDLAEIVMTDPALVARIMKLANSSFYGLPNRVDSLAKATTLIGIQNLKNIALSFVIIKDFQDAPQGSFDLNVFWKRAVCSAVSAEVLASHVEHKDHDIFISALLQDIGILVMFLSDPSTYTELLDTKRISGKSICEAEMEYFGTDHAEIGSYLLGTWNLPETITGPILYHHSQEPVDTHRNSSMILGFADKIAAIYHGTQSNRKAIEVRQGLKRLYHFQDEYIDGIIDTIGDKSREVLEFFAIPPGDMKPFSQIMQEAVEELGRLNFSYEQIVLELKQAKHNAEQLAFNLKKANDKLRELAFRDELTGLYNHRYFQEFIESEVKRAIRYKHPLSLLLIDIDYFKSINDTFGHIAGDKVLREVSQVMVRLVRQNDMVARYGGEEFAVVLPETGQVGAKVIAQRLRRGIEQLQIQQGGQPLSVTVSIGMASTDMANLEAAREALIAQSDRALYRAKRNGRNRLEI
ncbi:MAG: GGDEF domain-containing protein [Desulfobulbaceae bacterium]|nr:MAG: GGDEF domain-containing protein [Desulfobulbaceae bacterium]